VAGNAKRSQRLKQRLVVAHFLPDGADQITRAWKWPPECGIDALRHIHEPLWSDAKLVLQELTLKRRSRDESVDAAHGESEQDRLLPSRWPHHDGQVRGPVSQETHQTAEQDCATIAPT
jgi:hypothetical protein